MTIMLKDLNWRGAPGCRYAFLYDIGGYDYSLYHYGDSLPARHFGYVDLYNVYQEIGEEHRRHVFYNADALTVQCWLSSLTLRVNNAPTSDPA